MNSPKPGDIFLVEVDGAIGTLIRVGQFLNGDGFSKYEHAGVVINDALDTIEAMPGGAERKNLLDHTNIRVLSCPPEFGVGVAEAALGFLGVGYSALDYLALATHRLHIPAPGLRRYIETSKHMICSQLADRAAQLGGWQLFSDGRWPGYVTPGALNSLWQQSNQITL